MYSNLVQAAKPPRPSRGNFVAPMKSPGVFPEDYFRCMT